MQHAVAHIAIETPEFGVLTGLTAGDGDSVLVILHGVGGNAEGWSTQLDDFAAHHRVIAWNAPGYGGSSAMPMSKPNLQDYARALIAFLDGLSLRAPVHLLGHSLGGLVAASAAASNPTRVGRLVLAACSSGHRRYSLEERERILSARLAFSSADPAAYARSRAPSLLSSNPDRKCVERAIVILSRLQQPGFSQATQMVSEADIFEFAGQVAAPTRIICGAEDRVTPEALCRRIAQAIPGADYVSIPGAGHWAFLEHPTTFDRLVLEFLGPAEPVKPNRQRKTDVQAGT